jgi:Tol biopolymer transport system component
MVLPLEFRATATWILSGREIVYAAFGDAASSPAVWAFNLQTRRKRIVYNSGDTPLRRGLSLSPGGTSIFFARLDRWQSNVIVADYEIAK